MYQTDTRVLCDLEEAASCLCAFKVKFEAMASKEGVSGRCNEAITLCRILFQLLNDAELCNEERVYQAQYNLKLKKNGMY